MENKAYRVSAIPTGSNSFTLECSECGPVGVARSEECDEYCLAHLESHGVDVTKYRKF